MRQIRYGFGNKHFGLEVFDVKHEFLESFDDGFFVEEKLGELLVFGEMNLERSEIGGIVGRRGEAIETRRVEGHIEM